MADGVRQVARRALGTIAAAELEALVAAFDIARTRAQMAALGLCPPDASETDVAILYFGGRCRAVSPNAYFDEAWYLQHYPDVRAALGSPVALSGFVHFVRRGIGEARWPNAVLAAASAACREPEPARATLDGPTYLRLNPGAVDFLRAFPSLTPLAHFNLFGRRLGYRAEAATERIGGEMLRRVVQPEFDAGFYAARYLGNRRRAGEALAHYLASGAAAGNAPNAQFDEAWYRAFYADVREAIADGVLPCGFYHFVAAGRAEGRLPRHSLAAALEARMPGVTRPALLDRVADLTARIEGPDTLPDCAIEGAERRRVWVFLPTLNPDIMFGGYRAALWLIAALARDGFEPVIVCRQERPNAGYFLHCETNETINAVFRRARILGAEDFAATTIAPGDRFLAYSIWDLPLCARLAARAGGLPPLLLAQEYEPIFYENGAQRALADSLYALPHHAIFNSRMLQRYFEANRLGVFAPGAESGRHGVFEHRIATLPRQTATAMRERRERRLVLYARPEMHAARNLFELAIMALRRATRAKRFGPEWRFEGIGALSRLPPIDLGGGHTLVLHEKMAEAEYRETVGAMDIGISLMLAPHPSVMPFEFATTGALVITNTYQNRDAGQLRAICANLVPCAPTLDGVDAAIAEALDRVEDFAAREAQALIPDPRGWDAIFSPDFIAGNFGAAVCRAKAPVLRIPKRVPAPPPARRRKAA